MFFHYNQRTTPNQLCAQQVQAPQMTDPVEFVVKQLPYDLSSHGGWALVGRLFKRINLPAMVDPKYPVRAGIANSDILKCYVAMLTLGKNDFEAVEAFRQQRFAHQALGLRAVPSSATLRQRFDAMGCENGANWPTRAFARSTFKTDMDLNRLPSGKFATHHLVCALAALAMNLLRIVGQYTLHESGLKHG
jgi:hypothetical protein